MKKIAIVTNMRKIADFYAEEIKNLFQDQLETAAYSVEDGAGILVGIEADLIMVSTHGIYDLVKRYVRNCDDIFIADITLKKQSLNQMRQLLPGTKAMLVNITLEMAVETIGLIYNSGISHVEIVPFYPGMKEPPACSLAITPGERELVPPWVTEIIDLQDRVLSTRTIVNVATRLNLEYLLQTAVFENYFQTLARADYGTELLLDEVSSMEKKLNLVMKIFDGSIITLNRSGKINFINKSAEKILNRRQEQILGSTLEETIPPLAVFAPRLCSAKEGEAAKEEMPVKDRIITFEEQLLSISVYPLSDPEGISGHLILIKRFTDIEKEQYTLRRQIVSRGYAAKYSFDDIVGRSESIITLKETAGKMARSDSALLIYGQSGTGKELFAQSVHNSSNRKDNPFIAINCASIPENLLESELFGYNEGAFTGAKKGGKVGYFELANKGTLFLDEISEMNLALQTRLLRVLQEKEIIRIGGDRVINIDVRIISASNKNLKKLVRNNQFRQDLYYRLNVLSLHLPPLCQRREDIPVLLEQFQEKLKTNFEFTKEAMEAICRCRWEGNVRELGNFAERLMYLGKQRMDLHDVLSLMDDENDGMTAEPDFGGEEAVLMEHFLRRFRNQEKRYAAVLKILKEGERRGEKLGRGSISRRLALEDVRCTEQEVRTILKNLSDFTMVHICPGRGGTAITGFGIRVLDFLNRN